MNLVENFKAQKETYLKRYKRYLMAWLTNQNDLDSHGHAMECSWVLIEIFGMSEKELRTIDSSLEQEVFYGNEK